MKFVAISCKFCLYLVYSSIFGICGFINGAPLQEGSNCKDKGPPSKCTKVTNCPPAIHSVLTKKSHSFKRCGFDGFEEIVCCPLQDLEGQLNSGSISSTESYYTNNYHNEATTKSSWADSDHNSESRTNSNTNHKASTTTFTTSFWGHDDQTTSESTISYHGFEHDLSTTSNNYDSFESSTNSFTNQKAASSSIWGNFDQSTTEGLVESYSSKDSLGPSGHGFFEKIPVDRKPIWGSTKNDYDETNSFNSNVAKHNPKGHGFFNSLDSTTEKADSSSSESHESDSRENKNNPIHYPDEDGGSFSPNLGNNYKHNTNKYREVPNLNSNGDGNFFGGGSNAKNSNKNSPIFKGKKGFNKTNDNKRQTTAEPTHVRSPVTSRISAQACEEYSNELKPTLSFYIIEGEDAEMGEFPHMVALGYPNIEEDGQDDIKWNCGGSLISDQWVLTAAHCVINSQNNSPTVARIGFIKLVGSDVEPQEFKVTDIKVHSSYKRIDKINDIALLKLDRKVKLGEFVTPACLYNKQDDPTGLVISGWGKTDNAVGGPKSNILQKAKLQSVAVSECNNTVMTRIKKAVIASQICASHEKSDTCEGDSGGPLQVQSINNSNIWSIVGVTSYGIGCGTKYPGIYTRVFSYLDWIEGIVWKNNVV